MASPRLAVVIGLAALLLGATLITPAPRSTAAQSASGLTLSLTPNLTKAKIGEVVEFTVRVENTGTETIPSFFVSLGLPDALDAQTSYCPFSPVGSVTDCELRDFAPGSIAGALFYVHVGSRAPNGPVTAFALDGSGHVFATAQIAPIKIIGPSKTH
jgi:uncharacterized repeat protein (TIGR01451 family)